MPTENDLRDAFATADAPNTLDARRIVARSRARRLPRQLAAGSVGALALAGVVVLGVQVTQLSSPSVSTAGGGAAYDSSESAPAPEADTMVKRAPADKINLCTAPLTELAPSQYGLQLDVLTPGEATAGTAPIAVTVRLTNTSDDRVVGSTGSLPAVTLSQGGIVTWHTNGTPGTSFVFINLAPGASVDYTTTFTPVRCDVVDDEGEAFRLNLPALEPGSYQLSALIDFTADPSMGQEAPELDLVSGPLSPITLD
ncbi:MAG: hypothetical protein JWR04_266 [Rhodoglobus sp.]|nr:hypothetical protein [Rhodoglobus sp.]